MIWHAGVSVAALLATAAGALPSSAGANDFPPVGRPNIFPWPHGCGKPHHPSPPRDRHCNVVPRGQGQDDAPGILKAFRSCNNGGTVVLDKSYTIGTPLDLTFLKHVDVVISGTINFTTDLDFWVENAFKYAFQTTSTFWRFGGEDVNIYGGGKGTINGNGQPWWDANVVNATILRPILMVVDGLNGGTISGINMINPPNWFNLIANSSNIIVSNMNLGVHQTSTGPAHNTDGWDTFRSDSIVIQDSVINNTDDCVSFKPNSTNMVVQNLHCNGSHGISVGSLGQYIGVVDIVQDIYVYNISMANASDGDRIKVWPGIQSIAEPNLSGGGGTGFVKNITYVGLKDMNVDYAIEINQCYGQSNATLCAQYPSNMTISDVLFKDFSGTASPHYDPTVGTLACSNNSTCSNIRAENVNISTLSGKTAEWICRNIDTSLLQLNCV